MSEKFWKRGSVLAEFRADGTLHIYAPDSNRVLGRELAEELSRFLLDNLTGDFGPVPEPASPHLKWEDVKARKAVLDQMTQDTAAEAETVTEFGPARQDTVPAGDVATSEGVSTPDPKPPIVKRRPGRPRKVQP